MQIIFCWECSKPRGHARSNWSLKLYLHEIYIYIKSKPYYLVPHLFFSVFKTYVLLAYLGKNGKKKKKRTNNSTPTSKAKASSINDWSVFKNTFPGEQSAIEVQISKYTCLIIFACPTYLLLFQTSTCYFLSLQVLCSHLVF